MPLGRLGTARYWKCQRCPHKLIRTGAGWRHAHCDYAGGDLGLTDELLDGPEGNCPAGLWAGLEPVALSESRQRQDETALALQRAAFKPIVVAALGWLKDAEAKSGFLVQLVAEGRLGEPVALECAEEAGVDLDAS